MGFLEMGIDIFGHDDFGLTLLFVEDGVLQGFAFVEDDDLTLCVLTDGDLGLAESVGRAGGLDLVDDFVVLQGEVL